MRLRFALLVLSSLIADVAFGQSKCNTSGVGTNVFDSRPEFRKELQKAKTLFVTVYHNPQSGLVNPPPPDSVEAVMSTIAALSIATNDEKVLIRNVKSEMTRWGRYTLTGDMSSADLILVIKLGRKASDPVPNGNNFDIPQQFLWDDSLHLYSKTANPGLIWCGTKAGGLHPSKQGLSLLQRLVANAEDVPSNQ